MQSNPTLFKRKVLSFTVIQVGLLSFLLILSVVLRVMLYPLSYLESLPLYCIVGFFFLWEMLQFFFVSKRASADSRHILRDYRHGLPWRIAVSLAAGACISFFLSTQPGFTAMLFLMFFVVEVIFDLLFYRYLLGR